MTIQQLTPLAKNYGIKRLHSLCKEDLIEILYHRMLRAEFGAHEKTDPFIALTAADDLKKAQHEVTEDSNKTQNHISQNEDPCTENSASSDEKITDTNISPEPPQRRTRSRVNSTKFPFAATSPSEKTGAAIKKGRLEDLSARLSQVHDLAYFPDSVSNDIQEESLQVNVVDSYWLHVIWCLRRITIERARIALGHLWYDSKPVLAVTLLSETESGSVRQTLQKYIDIHGGINHWYINVTDPPGVYQVEIGYLAPGRFYSMLKGNIVKTSHVRSALRYEQKIEDDLFLHPLKPAAAPKWSPSDRNMYVHWQKKNANAGSRNGKNSSKNPRRVDDNHLFQIETEMIVYGMTSPESQVTVDQEWVAVQPDGTFMLRFDLPEQGRQMLTIDSTNREESKKIILTLERITKFMEPKVLDDGMLD